MAAGWQFEAGDPPEAEAAIGLDALGAQVGAAGFSPHTAERDRTGWIKQIVQLELDLQGRRRAIAVGQPGGPAHQPHLRIKTFKPAQIGAPDAGREGWKEPWDTDRAGALIMKLP